MTVAIAEAKEARRLLLEIRQRLQRQSSDQKVPSSSSPSIADVDAVEEVVIRGVADTAEDATAPEQSPTTTTTM